MAIDSLGREVDHRTPCDEGKHEESPNGCKDPGCDCPCHSGDGQAMRAVAAVMDDLGKPEKGRSRG